MSFGNFLLGVAEGLDYGVEAGDRIMGARDRKKIRDAKGTTPAAPASAPANVAPRAPLSAGYATPPIAATMGARPPSPTQAAVNFPAGIASNLGVAPQMAYDPRQEPGVMPFT
jgi:hypothetical protein